ncbi:MAG: Maf family protein [Thermoanaerobaculia bacterium]
MPAPRLVLASASPRRREILQTLGLAFEIRAADVDESLVEGENPYDAAERLARGKAACIAESERGATVIAADTIVVLDGCALGKPADREDSLRMLRALSGRRHEVVTGLAVAWNGNVRSGRDVTGVVFVPMAEEEIRSYAASGEPDDKAGAYALQGLGGIFIERVEGSPSNVIGLPVRLLVRLLGEAGIGVPALSGRLSNTGVVS